MMKYINCSSDITIMALRVA